MSVESAQLIGLKSNIINDEYEYPYKTNSIKSYTIASYVCLPNKKFSGIDQNLLKYKIFEGRSISYFDYSCVGKDEWEEVKCN